MVKVEGRKAALAASIGVPLYGVIRIPTFRSLLRRILLRAEGGAMYSLTVREIYRRYHGLEVGLYTIGPCETGPENFSPGTTIGRYCSIYYTVRTLRPDEPDLSRVPQGLLALDRNKEPDASRDVSWTLAIGNDVFIGHNAIILSTVGEIGHGAFIGAGSVVNKPVPPYAVVMGNPARVVRYRFSEKTISSLIESKWWLKSVTELSSELPAFQKPLEA